MQGEAVIDSLQAAGEGGRRLDELLSWPALLGLGLGFGLGLGLGRNRVSGSPFASVSRPWSRDQQTYAQKYQLPKVSARGRRRRASIRTPT